VHINKNAFPKDFSVFLDWETAIVQYVCLHRAPRPSLHLLPPATLTLQQAAVHDHDASAQKKRAKFTDNHVAARAYIYFI
jgi:hypothetical protein